ncbi:MAG: hypothetical protein OXG07_11455 [Anaerolineaceae bacterium]|nr:hypothetical protein [Anaerolineaceae bacterium]
MAKEKGDTRLLVADETVQDGQRAAMTGSRSAPPRRPRRLPGCCGCLSGLATLFAVMTLVVIGLLLPPVNLGRQAACLLSQFQIATRITGPCFRRLDSVNRAVRHEDGLTLQVAAEDPGEGFSIAIEALPAADFAGGDRAAAWVSDARAAIPADLALQSPVFSLYSDGLAPQTITLDLTLPAGVGSAPVFSLYGWNGMGWEFLPSQQQGNLSLRASLERLPQQLALFQATPPSQPTVLVTVEVQHTLSPEIAQLANIIAPAGIQPTLAGGLTGSLAAGFDFESGYLVMPVVRNFIDERAIDPHTTSSILANRELRRQHVAQLSTFAGSGFDGLLIDWRGLQPEEGRLFTEFIRELAAGMAESSLSLGVVVPPATFVNGQLDTGAYNWRELGRQADIVQLRLPLQPEAYGPGQAVQQMLRHAVGEVERSRLLAGYSAWSLRESGGSLTKTGLAEAYAGLGDVVIDVDTTDDGAVQPGTPIFAGLDGQRAAAGFDGAAMAPWIEYRDGDAERAVRYWLTTGETLRSRLDRSLPFALAGVSLEGLLAPARSQGLGDALLTYKLGLPVAPQHQPPTLRWRIEGTDGVQSETLTGLDADLQTTLIAPDGNYAINVDVVTGDDAVARDGMAIGLLAPTPTPTPTPTPAPTAVPRPAVAPAAAPAAGSIQAGAFEYGGHVSDTGSGRAVNAMRQAGMTWMKKQVRHPGGDAGGVISAARSNGFKVLIGALGDKNQLAARGAAYMDEFAAWLGQVAAQGADAIEVWNEPNIDREWPQGQINGNSFADLMRRAHAAIKSANPATMVISGAPAPTGFFGGRCTANGCDDNVFLQQFVAAGGTNHMDCLGAHYNAGVSSPRGQSGHPGGYHYSYYFWPMLNEYSKYSGGKPICFTELGYLSPQGYGPLPAHFSWAGNVTVQQQAAWLADSIALSSQSGRVRLLIVWNVDFTYYGADPQAGYAMIRPDGSCPACGAIAAAR